MTVVLKLTKISSKLQLQIVVLQFLLEPQLVTVVLKVTEISLKPQFYGFTIIFNPHLF